MPYVEVWVDEPECDGNCGGGDELKRRRDYAVSLLFNGDPNAAIDALTKGALPESWRVESDLQAQYATWSKGELEGFDGPASLTTTRGDA